MDGTNNTGISLLTRVPEWFLALAGIVYATGFLIVFTYFESFGIHETGAEFFKVKYVHVGILCTMFVILLGVPCLAYRFMRLAENKNKRDNRRTGGFTHLSSMVFVLNMVLTFYGLVMFSPHGYIETRSFLIPVILMATSGWLILMRILESKQLLWADSQAGAPPKNVDMEQVANIGRWFVGIIGLVILDWYSFRGLGHTLWQMLSGAGTFKTGGYIFLMFVLVIMFLLWRVSDRVKEIPDVGVRIALWAVTGCLLLAIYYLAVLSFAYRVYPYIPVDRGGGSFVDSSTVKLRFKNDARNSLPSEIVRCEMNSCTESIPLVFIEATSTVVFVANPADAGGAAEWRQGRRPQIYAVRSELIDSMFFDNLR